MPDIDKSVTGSECMQTIHEYRTFEKELKKELIRKLRNTFDEAFKEFIVHIERYEKIPDEKDRGD